MKVIVFDFTDVGRTEAAWLVGGDNYGSVADDSANGDQAVLK